MTRSKSSCLEQIIGVSIAFFVLGGLFWKFADEPVRGPLDAVAGDVIALWEEADLVCLGENHGSTADAALRKALVEHPDFARTVDVIVVEFASPLHQERLDRLMLKDGYFSREDIRPVWQDAGGGAFWETPMYEEFFSAVGRRNMSLSREHRIRVVGAALPSSDSADPRRRIDHFAEVMRREVLTPGLKGLAIFGLGHCERRPPSALSTLAEDEPERVRAVFGFEVPGGEAAGREHFELDEEPRLIPVRATPTAATHGGEMFFEGHAHAGATIGDLVDAIVYYGDFPNELLTPNS